VLRRSVCRQVSGPTPPPTPSPTPTPTPTPPSSGGSGGGPAQQDILNHTIAWAGELGRSFVSPVTHTFTSTVNGCKMIKADTGRCTIWRWVDAGIVGSDSGREVHRIDFYRVYAFSQWVTTSGIYDDYSQTFDIIDPAQSCLTVDNQNLYGCTPLVPGAG
jgi:hypothetical protein